VTLVAKRSSAELKIRTLGGFAIARNDQEIPENAWPRRKTKELFKILLTAPGAIFTIDQLIDILLPDADVRRASSNIRARASELRAVLEPDRLSGQKSQYIRRVGEGYAFLLDSNCWVDIVAFETGLAKAQEAADETRWTDAVDQFEKTLCLYRGSFLNEDRYAEWAESTRAHLRQRYLEGTLSLALCYARLDRSLDALRCYQKVLAVDPCDERSARQLMRLLHDTGRSAQAVRVYRHLAESLRTELDVEPSEETLSFFRQITQREPTPVTQLDPCRIAVIPFVSVDSDPQSAILADGMTEELIYTLSKVSGLEVIAQTTVLKYKGARKSVAEIGRELRVGSVLEGSTQKEKNRARILVQLIDVQSEAHLWAEQFDQDLPGFFAVQASIAQRTADALRVRLLLNGQTTIETEARLDSEAQATYIQGRQLLDKRTAESSREAVARFGQVVAVAPRHTRALVGLAEAHLGMAEYEAAAEHFQEAKHCAETALGIDPNCAEAHGLRGHMLLVLEGDTDAAERELLRAVDLSPSCTTAHTWYANLLARTDRLEEACRYSEMAASLDPLSGALALSYAVTLHTAGRLAKAVDQFQKAIAINPEQEDAWWGLWYSLAGAWDWDRAEQITRQGVANFPKTPFSYINLATCLMCRGRIEEGLSESLKAIAITDEPKRTVILFHVGACHYFARKYETAIAYLREVLERNPSSNPSHNMIAKCCIQLGLYDEALAELDAAESAFGGATPFWQTHVHMDRGKIFAHLGAPSKAEKELAILMKNPGRPNYRIAVSGILSALGRIDEAWEWLESAATAREHHIAALRKAPDLDSYRSHPRYLTLLRRVGLSD